MTPAKTTLPLPLQEKTKSLKIGLTEGRKNNGQKVKVKRQRVGRKWQDTNDQK